jgi:hypothetical protein
VHIPMGRYQHGVRFVMTMIALTASAGAYDEKNPIALNQKVLEFARGKVGQVVGNGECTALVFEAYRYAGARRFWRPEPGAEMVWGERLESVKDARPGDVLQFRDAVFKGHKTYRNGSYKFWEYSYPHHTAIVADVKKTKSGTILTLLHQNVGPTSTPENESKPVRRDSINLSELQPGGQVIAYRPVAK